MYISRISRYSFPLFYLLFRSLIFSQKHTLALFLSLFLLTFTHASAYFSSTQMILLIDHLDCSFRLEIASPRSDEFAKGRLSRENSPSRKRDRANRCWYFVFRCFLNRHCDFSPFLPPRRSRFRSKITVRRVGARTQILAPGFTVVLRGIIHAYAHPLLLLSSRLFDCAIAEGDESPLIFICFSRHSSLSH